VGLRASCRSASYPPRYPLEFTCSRTIPELDSEKIQRAMKVMDEGYMAQDYYHKAKYMIPLEGKKEETFTYESYSWTEHISRKAGLWMEDYRPLFKQMAKCGFKLFEELSSKPE
jgi:hypothetical protein